MKNIFFIVLSILALVSCKSKQNKLSDKSLMGLWTEHWEKDTINPDKSVDYVDTLRIFKDANKLAITCINNDEYIYSNIKLQGSNLTFTKENTSDPNEEFFVYYTFDLNKNNKEFTGSIVNSVNEHNNVSLKKLQKKAVH